MNSYKPYIGLANRQDLFNDDFNEKINFYRNIKYNGFPNDGWNIHWARKWEFPTVIEAIRDFAKECKVNIVESGSGITPVPFILSTFGYNVTGVDLELEQTLEEKWNKVSVPNGGDFKFIKGDMLDMPFEDNMFDVSYSISAIEHTGNAPKAIEELIRVTKPGGFITFTIDIDISNSDSVPVDHFYLVQDILQNQVNPTYPVKIAPPTDLLTFNHRTVQPQSNFMIGLKMLFHKIGFYKLKDQTIFFYAGVKK